MASELEDLKAAMEGVDPMDAPRHYENCANAVIAHLEARITELERKLFSETRVVAGLEEEGRLLRARLSECREWERALRRYAAHHSECGAETNDTAFGNCTCGLSAALEVKK